MTEASDDKPVKTDLDKAKDIISHLKEMRHYSESNIERLTASWLLLEGELKQKKLAKEFEDLISQENKLHDAVEAVIDDYEAVCSKMESKT